MITDTACLLDLIDAATDLETHGNLERGLQQLARTTARRLGTARCSIMLLREDTVDGELCLRLFASFGDLPEVAFDKVTRTDEGVAGYVATTGRPLLIGDITRSEFARDARYPNAVNKGLISAPLRIEGRVIGVINVSEPEGGHEFQDADLGLVEILALVVSKSIHVFELQGILRSKLLQAAAARDLAEHGADARPIAPDPARLTKIVAKSIYRELTGAGFGPNQIIGVATEVIDQLHGSMDGGPGRDSP
jgi:GAF domain-containing protein